MLDAWNTPPFNPAGTDPAVPEPAGTHPPDALPEIPGGSEAPGGADQAPSDDKEAPSDDKAAPSDDKEAPSDDKEAGTLAVWLREPAAGGVSCAAWTGFGLAVGLLAAAIAVCVARALRRRRKRPDPQPVAWNGNVTVEKLHEQGARDGQQDCFFVSPPEERAGVLAVVADGMGGLADGDKVSEAAVSAMAHGFYQTEEAPQAALLQLAEQANAAVNRLLGDDVYNSGSTLAAGLLRDGAFHYLSVGDSRICLYRQGILYQLNREHIYRNDLAVRFVNGEESLENVTGHPKAAGLTSFLGMGQLKYVDLPAEPVTVRPGDRFLLMSDGVYNALTRGELAAALEGESCAEAIREAIRAKAYQNQDNYTAVILTCR